MSDELFENAGISKGLQIWRIENFLPVPVKQQEYGKFFTGDSYIVLNTKQSKRNVLSWDVHFWLGLETSQDEAGSAAIYTIQLDDHLNGSPVQHRETQEHESPLFMSYFKNGVRYAAGGVATGFSHVTTNEEGETRLFRVKGKRDVRVRQVELSVDSMNQGDCFLLDSGNTIFVYVGATANRAEKLKAIRAANQIRDQDHNGRSCVEILDEFCSDADREGFFAALGSGSPADVAEAMDDDEEYERRDNVTLYRVSDASGTLEVSEVGRSPLQQEQLDEEDCFILDTGIVLYVWVGRQSNKLEKDKAMQNAQEFIASHNYPSWTQVQRIVQNAEPAPFKQFFATWRDQGRRALRLIRAANGDDSSEASSDDEDAEYDPSVLHALVKSGGNALQFMPDDGEAEAHVFRVSNFALEPVDCEAYGQFYAGDSYVVRYDYANKRGGTGVVIYSWQGKDSSPDEKATAVLMALEMGSELNAVQVRVEQGYEPRHFLKIFHGKLMVFRGGNASGFRNTVGSSVGDSESYESGNVRLFRVRGTDAYDLRAEQRPAVASSLGSDDSFVLETPTGVYVWHGRGASEHERSVAVDVAGRLQAENADSAAICAEGEEPEEFWSALGGKDEYDTEVLTELHPLLEPRLFHCAIRYNGRLVVDEVIAFTQQNLSTDDVMVLDGGDEVYIWEGENATKDERTKSYDMAVKYIRSEASKRSEESVSFITIKQGHEPRSFKRLFKYWDDDLWLNEASAENA